MAASLGDSTLPAELRERLADFDLALSEIETNVKPLLDVPHSELMEKLSPLDKAKVELLTAYTINSLFWMYLNVCGINPKEHAVKGELDRVRSYMKRVKDIQDKEKAPRLDKGAAKRFMKNALWSAAHAKSKPVDAPSEEMPSDISGTLNQTPDVQGKKRKSMEKDIGRKKKKTDST